MKHYKDNAGNFYGVDSGQQAHPDWVEVTLEEIQAANEAKAKAAFDALPYDVKRQAEYPPMTDYLDAVVKGDEVAKQAYIDACLAVKAKYPKEIS